MTGVELIAPTPVAPWPWGRRWDKRGASNRIRSLVRAGALLGSENDRLQRAEAAEAA